MAVNKDLEMVVNELWQKVRFIDPVSLDAWIQSENGKQCGMQCAKSESESESEIGAKAAEPADTKAEDEKVCDSKRDENENEEEDAEIELAVEKLKTSIGSALGGISTNYTSPDDKNYLLKLIAPDKNGTCHIRLAMEFVCTMAERPELDSFLQGALDTPSSEGRDINNDRGNAILHEAAKFGCCGSLRRFLTESNVNQVNTISETPLHLAAEFGQEEDVKILADVGARATLDNDGCSPLHSAAMSTEPNRKVVEFLTKMMVLDHALINARSNDDCNTALHYAAGNAASTPEFIAAFRDCDPRVRNSDKLTPFHVAAEHENPDIIVAMLKTFAPTRCGWDIDDAELVDGGKVFPTLLDICAGKGNAAAVALLIQHGADVSKGVFHTIVLESVRSPSKIDKLIEVFRTVKDNSVVWRCLEEHTKCPIRGSATYDQKLAETMRCLITKPHPANSTQKSHPKNVIERAIDIGASALLHEILNTEGVFKFDNFHTMAGENHSQCSFSTYDVTHFVSLTDNKPKKSSSTAWTCLVPAYIDRKHNFAKRFKPTESYLIEIINREDEWRDSDILKKQPFRELTKPFIGFVLRLYLILGILQFVYMFSFSVHYLPSSSWPALNYSRIPSASNCSDKVTDAVGSTAGASWLWLLWPISLFVYNVGEFALILVRLASIGWFTRCCHSSSASNKVVKRKYGELFSTKLLLLAFSKIPAVAFSVSIFKWHSLRSQLGDDNLSIYLEVTAMVFLFGWMLTFIFLSGISKVVYIFSLVLREIIVKDILARFALVCLFSVVGFSFSLHVLRQTPQSATDAAAAADDTVYEVFAAALGVGDFFERTLDNDDVIDPGRLELFRVVFAVYVTFMAVVLINLLIAMMSHRYDDARSRAENVWRFETLEIALRIHNWKIFQSFTQMESNCCFSGICCCCASCNEKKIYTENDKTYMNEDTDDCCIQYLDVQKKD